MLSNEYLLAKIGADTAENEQNVAEILPKVATTLRSYAPARRPAGLAARAPPRRRAGPGSG